MLRPDSLIFDMDGTLWDNVDTYVIAWNRGLERTGHRKQVSRSDMLRMMGAEARVMLQSVLPGAGTAAQDRLFEAVIDAYQQLLGQMQPLIYEGVLTGLEQLSQKYRLFMLSNCEEGGLVNFMRHTRTSHLFLDYMEHGMNLQPKHHNLRLLIEKHGLQSPLYVGDTDSDSRQSALAGVPFVFVSYGFGNTEQYLLQFDSFASLTSHFMNC
jgi:phosphoglycolate phosphatase